MSRGVVEGSAQPELGNFPLEALAARDLDDWNAVPEPRVVVEIILDIAVLNRERNVARNLREDRVGLLAEVTARLRPDDDGRRRLRRSMAANETPDQPHDRSRRAIEATGWRRRASRGRRC